MVYYWFSGKTPRGAYKEGYSGSKANAIWQAKKKGLEKFVLVKHADRTGKELSRQTVTVKYKKTKKRIKK